MMQFSGGLNTQERTYRSGTRLAPHCHELASLSLMLQGEQSESVGRRRYQCPTYSAVLKGPGIEHANTIGPRVARSLFAELSPEVADTLTRASHAPLGAVCFEDIRTRGLVHQIDRELRRPESHGDLMVESLVFELLGAMLQTRLGWGSGDGDGWITRALDYLEAHYRRRFKVADVAAACGVHPSHLAEIFRKRFASSVGEWVRNRRLEFARVSLLDPSQSISRVAMAAGFADQSHLTRLFRHRFGSTPAEYRRIHTRQLF
jgi:AraC family transcriptional regulator